MQFDELKNSYLPVIDPLLAASSGTSYRALFLEPDLKSIGPQTTIEDIYQMRAVYVLGILERSHLAGITYLARASRWLTATSVGVNGCSLLGFASGLRGHLESSADAFDVLQYLPNVLAKSMRYAFLTFAHPEDLGPTLVGFGPIEKKLIHYVYARREPGHMDPPEHRKKSSGRYNEQLEQFGVPRLGELYAKLCELVHPAASSVLCFLDEKDGTLVFNMNRDRELISEIILEYEDTIEKMTQYTLNSALISLSLLHRLNPAWIAAPDEAMSEVGNVSKKLAEFDLFVNDYFPGKINRLEIIKEVQG